MPREISAPWRSPCSTQAQALALSGGGDPHRVDRPGPGDRTRHGDGPLLAQAALVRVGSGVPEDKSAALIELTEPLELLAADAPERVDLLCAAAVIVTFIDGSPAAERLLDAAQQAYESTGSLRSEADLARRAEHRGRGAAAPTSSRCTRWRASPTRSPAFRRPGGDRGHDPGAAPRGVHARQPEGGRRTAARAGTGRRNRTLAVRRGQGVALQDDERDRARRARRVQQLIDATMREGNRYRTFNTEIAATVQQLLLLFERDELDLLADLVRLRAKEADPACGTPSSRCANDR